MTVKELIKYLQIQDQNLLVVIPMHSEYLLLTANEIKIQELCEPRNDGWVHDKRPDKPTRKYLTLA